MFQLHPNAVHGDDDLQRSGALSIAVLDHADAECDDAVEDGLPHPNPAEEDDDNEVNLNDSNDNAGNDDEDDDTVTSEYEDEDDDTAAEGGDVFGRIVVLMNPPNQRILVRTSFYPSTLL